GRLPLGALHRDLDGRRHLPIHPRLRRDDLCGPPPVRTRRRLRAGSRRMARLARRPVRRQRRSGRIDWPPPLPRGAMAAKSPPSNQRDKQRRRVVRLLKSHAPPDWDQRFRRDDLLDSVIDGRPIQMFVMAADIRESTTLMKESIRFEQFALVMDKFVSSVRRGIRNSGGWFDKFTGHGFLPSSTLQDP